MKHYYIRGGIWNYYIERFTTASGSLSFRNFYGPIYRFSDVGFRLIKTLKT